MKKILVLNSGSSSLKFQFFNDTDMIASGTVEQIGESKSSAKFVYKNEDVKHNHQIKDHKEALELVSSFLKDKEILKDFSELDACGHRVVHGGDKFFSSCIVDDKAIENIKEAIKLAPLHNKANLDGILTMKALASNVVNVAVFDTAFHQSMPDYAYTYAIDKDLAAKHKIRRYGFHGTSHKYVSELAAKYMNKDINEFNAIVLHLGNGASACAIQNGKSVDTSMGFSPLEGLVMGTRCGDIDPAALFYLADKENLDYKALDTLCNKKSGLVSLCGYNDMRDIDETKATNDNSRLAFDVFAYRVRKYLGAYMAVLPRVDAVIFTAGIGQYDDKLRKAVLSGLEHLGISFDEAKNNAVSPKNEIEVISKDDSKVKVLRINTNEELAIAKECIKLIK